MSATLPNSDWFPTFRKLWQTWQNTRVSTRLGNTLTLTERTDWRAIIDNAELPAAARKTIREVTLRTRLWRSEKASIAAELVAHFADGLEAGVSAEQLIADFGDVRATARLMRSAKRRCRPLWWQAWWWGSRGLVVLAVLYVVYALWQASLVPRISVDYLAQLNAPIQALPPEQRAWDDYHAALDLIDFQTFPAWLAYAYTEVEPGDPEWPEVVKWLEEHEEVIKLIERGSEKPYLGLALWPSLSNYDGKTQQTFAKFPLIARYLNQKDNLPQNADFGMSNAFISPHNNVYNLIRQILRLNLQRQIWLNQPAQALNTLRALLRVNLQTQLEYSAFMVRSSSFHILYDVLTQVHGILRDRPDFWSDEELIKIAHLLSTVGFSPQRELELKRQEFQDALQRIYSDDGQGDGQITAAGLELLRRHQHIKGQDKISDGPQEQSPWTLPYLQRLYGTRRYQSDLYDQILAITQKAFDYPTQLKEYQAEYNRLQKTTQLKSAHGQDFLAPLNPTDNVRYHRIPEGYLIGTQIGIALELYRRENGDWPATLADLTPRFIPRIPLDPMYGGNFQYKIVEGQPVVYSVAEDGDDDGGKFLPREGVSGFDHAWMHYAALLQDQPTQPLDSEPLDCDWIIWTTNPIYDCN
ncbi:MAG: hypothetical protein SFX18_09730 [Pirellulales bacterium]|nr:hypothetical protein [Pirellulales bacterium]